ncbi:MAG: hypothetical protein WBD07_16405 [Vicinamibacterales bacterium]
MNVVPGARLGPYEIVASIGQGGMGLITQSEKAKLRIEKDAGTAAPLLARLCPRSFSVVTL